MWKNQDALEHNNSVTLLLPLHNETLDLKEQKEGIWLFFVPSNKDAYIVNTTATTFTQGILKNELLTELSDY